MNDGVAPPCSELGQSDDEHRLLAWMSAKVNKDGLVPLRPDKVTFRVYREAHVNEKQTFTHLEDGGWIEKHRVGESFRWKVLVTCSCAIDFRPPPLAAAASGVSMPEGRSNGASGHGYNGSTGSSSGYESLGVKSESVQKPVNQLARDFPKIMRDAGIQITPLQTNYQGLASNLRQWHYEWGVSISDIRQMMEEFAQHPEWCQRSKRSPWQIFVSRRDELASQMLYKQRKTAGIYERPASYYALAK